MNGFMKIDAIQVRKYKRFSFSFKEGLIGKTEFGISRESRTFHIIIENVLNFRLYHGEHKFLVLY